MTILAGRETDDGGQHKPSHDGKVKDLRGDDGAKTHNKGGWDSHREDAEKKIWAEMTVRIPKTLRPID
jgi:hypothetical protein